MSTLRTALILVLAGIAAPAFAEQITCESRQDRPEACGTVMPGSSVTLVEQISNSPCIEGRTWGADNESIWVSGGCRAVFDIQPRYSQVQYRSDEYRGNDERYRDERYHGTRYASADRAVARQACIDQASIGQSVGRDMVRTNDVRWLGEGVFSVSMDTPSGPMTCTVDRVGNVRSLDYR